MLKSPKKPDNCPENVQKSAQNSKIPEKLKNKASPREILEIIAQKQDKQDEKLDCLTTKVAVFEQRFNDYVVNHEKQECKDEKQKDRTQGNVKWIVATAFSVGMGLVGLLWGIFG
jgi:hypothetical protein